MNDNLQPRIGTAERERASTLLEQHLSAGRIGIGEFDERSARIHAATTQAQIDAVLADLPATPASPRRWKRYAAPAAFGGALVVLAAAIAIVTLREPQAQQAQPIVVTTIVAAPSSTPATTGSGSPTTTPTTSMSGSATTPDSASVVGTQYLADFRRLDDSNYYRFNTGAAAVSGTTYTRSVMINPRVRIPGYVEYDLARKYTRLEGILGVRDDATPSGLSMQFEIYADGVLIAGHSIEIGQTIPIDLDITNALRLRLQVTNVDREGNAYAVFGDLRATPK